MTPKLREKPLALKREHPVLKNMKILDFFYFCGSFLPSWIRIQQLKLMRIHEDPDPKPCLDVAQGGALQLRTVVTVRQLQKLHAVFIFDSEDQGLFTHLLKVLRERENSFLFISAP
jgi:hypothetical protein